LQWHKGLIKIQMKKCKIKTPYFKILTILCFTSLISACVTTQQVKSTKTSGFLNNYSQLKKGNKGETLLVYVDYSTNFKKYNKILFNPVQFYSRSSSKLRPRKKQAMQSIVNYLDATVREQLKETYIFVETPDKNTMELRIALTNAKKSRVVRDMMSSVLPYAIAISYLKKAALGKHSAVGSARLEWELIDSLTGKRLFAGVDERAGAKYTGKFDQWKKWQDAQDACDYWGGQLQRRMKALTAND